MSDSNMNPNDPRVGETAFTVEHSWGRKFRDAFRGVGDNVWQEASFRIHIPCALMVVVAAAVMRMTVIQWAVLLICITHVLTAEIFNTAMESFGRAIDHRFNAELKRGLDAASGAVLVSALGASAIGCLLFVHRGGQLLRWWQ
ncbi:MAG: Undecaprenol kinase [Planctomycetota bacterium]|jgi:diacylglycerol kinase